MVIYPKGYLGRNPNFALRSQDSWAPMAEVYGLFFKKAVLRPHNAFPKTIVVDRTEVP